MSRGKDARPRTRPADPCAFCGARVPCFRPTDEDGEGPGPTLCRHCYAGESIQFAILETIELVRPFARTTWRRSDIVDAGANLRFGVESRRSPSSQE